MEKILKKNIEKSLGIELGSTRIKAVLISEDNKVLAKSFYDWENKYENGIWTYSIEEVKNGVKICYSKLAKEIKTKYGERLEKIKSIGVSAMMHGYLAFDKDMNLLVPFRTWRNNNADEAAKELSELFEFNIPDRWSIAHLYQAIKNDEQHVKDIAFITTISGYVHFLLTGKKVLGSGDASGMLPLAEEGKNYNAKMLEKFDRLIKDKNYPWKIADILPKILFAGENAGILTKEGATFLDESGFLESGSLMCPPEGDAGTGMVATNSVRKKTGSVSAGTSIFGMFVLEEELKKAYPQIDIVATPSGDSVAMVHCNNCSSEINTWINLFSEVLNLYKTESDKSGLYETLFKRSLSGEPDCGGVIVYNYLSGENITEIETGRPMTVRKTECDFSLANFIRAQLYSTMITLKIGFDLLIEKEKVQIDSVFAHGGIFKTKDVCQKYLAAILNTPVTVTETAGEGGAYGIAVLANYAADSKGKNLAKYLDEYVFVNQKFYTLNPEKADVAGVDIYLDRFKKGLDAEKHAARIK
jgi:sugar (pentulose or hexulose) kinase